MFACALAAGLLLAPAAVLAAPPGAAHEPSSPIPVEFPSMRSAPAAEAARAAPARLLVRFRDSTTRAQQDLQGRVAGYDVSTRMEGIGWAVVEPRPGLGVATVATRLAAADLVEDIEVDAWAQPAALPDDEYFPGLWGLDNTGQTGGTADADIDAPEAWDVETGDPGVIVAVTDEGVDIAHPDLAGNVWTNPGEIPGNGTDDDGNGFVDDINGWDFRNGDATLYDVTDVDLHGTHVAGTIAAVGDNGVGVTGVSWDSTIMPVKFMSGGVDAGGWVSDGAAAIEYAVDHGADVINCSWTTPSALQVLVDAVDYAEANDVLLVCASGNDGIDTDVDPEYPAALESTAVVSVAATYDEDLLAHWSNHGAVSVDIAAPGVEITSTVPVGATAALDVSTGTYDVLYLGFPAEGIEDPVRRESLIKAGVDSLASATSDPILVVDDSFPDEEGVAAGYRLDRYTDALAAAGYTDVTTWSTQESTTPPLTSMSGRVVVWFTGQMNLYRYGSVGTLDSVDRARIGEYLDGGGRLLLSSGAVGFDLDYYSSDDPAWYADYLHADLLDYDAWSHDITATVGSGLDGEWGRLTDWDADRGWPAGSEIVAPLDGSATPAFEWGEYAAASGTSMASPHTAGVAALVRAAYPGIPIELIRDALFEGGDILAALDGEVASGARLNAAGALDHFADPFGGGMVLDGGADYTGSMSVSVESTLTWASDMRVDSGSGYGSWVPFAASVPADVTTGDGAKQVDVEYRHADGFTLVRSDTIVLDESAPTDPVVTSSSHTVGVGTVDDTVDIDLTGADDGAGSGVDGFSISWSEDAIETPDTVKDLEASETATTSPALSPGSWYANVRTVDAVGNWTSTAHAGPFVVDSGSPPTVWHEGPVGWSAPDATLTLRADDSESGVDRIEYIVTDPPGGIGVWAGSQASDTVTLTISLEGTTSVEYSAVNNVGSRSATATALVRVDGSPPLTGIDAPSGWQPGDVWVALFPEDALSGVSQALYRVGSGPVETYGGAFLVDATGATGIDYWSVDVAGNEEATRTAVVMIDRSAPSVDHSAPAGWSVSDVSVGLSAADAESGVGHIDYVVTDPPSGGIWSGSLASDAVTLTISLEGTTSVEYSAVNGAGSQSATETVLVRVDKSAPTGPTLSTPSHTAGAYSNDATVEVDLLGAADQHSGVDGYSLSWSESTAELPDTEKDLGAGETMVVSPELAEGDWYVNVRTVDVAGNWTSAVHLGPFRIDTTPPTSNDDAPDGWQGGDVDLLISASDASGIDRIDYVVTDPPPGGVWSGSAPSSTAAIAISDEGTTAVEYSATDVAGSRSTTGAATVRIDKSAPVHPSLSSPSHVEGAFSSDDTIELSLAGAADAFSGVDGFSVSWSQDASESPDALKDLDAGQTATTSPALADGAWYANVRTVDAAGNWTSAVHAGPFRIETTPPTVSDDAPTGWKNGRVDLTLLAADASGIARIDYVVTDPPPGGVWTGGADAAATVVGVTQEGVTAVEYSALDEAGSRSATATAIVRLDLTAPHTAATVESSYVGGALIELAATDSGGSGLGQTYYRLDGSPAAAYPVAGIEVTGLGNHTLEYWSVDAAGNAEGATTAAFEIVAGIVDYRSIAGSTRYETAIAASQEAFPRGADMVIIATGENWPDALGGAALAGAWDAPILLTPAATLPASVASEIGRLGAADAIILGGPGAVSSTVGNELLSQLGAGHVFRLGGATRYDTADLVARAVANKLGSDYDGTAFVTTGLNFPDALAGSPLAAAGPWPILLVPDTGPTAATQQAARDIGVDELIILGGEGVVTPATMAALEAAYGAGNVARLAGPTRYETAWEVASFGVDEAGLAWDGVAIATGENFPDALSGGALQGQSGSVMALTLTAQLPPVVATGLADERDAIEQVRFLGGTGAVSEAVRSDVRGILE